MSTERNVEQYCEDYADEHGLSAVTDHQYAMRLKAENAKLKEKATIALCHWEKCRHRIGHIYSAHPLSNHVLSDMDVVFGHMDDIKQALKE